MSSTPMTMVQEFHNIISEGVGCGWEDDMYLDTCLKVELFWNYSHGILLNIYGNYLFTYSI